MTSGSGQLVGLSTVLGFCENLEIPSDVQAAHVLPAQRNDVIHNVLNARRRRHFYGRVIHPFYCVKVCPTWQRLLFGGLSSTSFCGHYSSVRARVSAILLPKDITIGIAVGSHSRQLLFAMRCIVYTRLSANLLFPRRVVRLLLRNVFIPFGVVIGLAAGARFVRMCESPALTGCPQLRAMCLAIRRLFNQKFRVVFVPPFLVVPAGSGLPFGLRHGVLL